MTYRQFLLTGLLILVGPGLLNATVIPMLTDGSDVSFWTTKADVGPGVDSGAPPGFGTYGVENVAGPAGVGTGDVARIWDWTNVEKPELRRDLNSGLLNPFTVSFDTLNQSGDTTDFGDPIAFGNDSKAIRFRMSNAGDSITSESRVAFSVSWQTDGKLTVKHEAAGGGALKTEKTDVLVGAKNIFLVINPNPSSTYAYNEFALARVLQPLHYDVYIDGVLFNSDPNDPDYVAANGLGFTLNKSLGTYDPNDGLGQIGFVGSSNSDFGPDYLFDNVILDTIPEPTSMFLLLGSGLLISWRFRWR